jgi:cell division protein FtsN
VSAGVAADTPRKASAAGAAETTRKVSAAGAADTPKRVARAAGTGSGQYWVQVGAFKDRELAERLTTRLARKGHAAVVTQGTLSGAQHVVRVGSYPSRERALAVQTALRNEGVEGFLVSAASGYDTRRPISR